MQKSIQLHVPKPCHENWDNMNDTEKGRFCLSCKKEVIDFTLMSDQQILHHISRSGKGFCGRFSNKQLNRDIKDPGKQKLAWFKYFVHVIVPALLISNESKAQETRMIGDTTVFVPAKNQFQNLTGKVDVRGEIQTNRKSFIEGIITDEKQIPVPFASIMIKGTKEAVSSDADGKFRIEVKKNLLTVTLSVASVGYEQKEFVVKDNLQNIRIELKMASTKGLGEVIVVGYTVSRKKQPVLQQLKDSVISLCKKEVVKVYPNPIHFGSTFNIDFDMKETGEYKISISNISGQPLIEKKIVLNSKTHVEQMTLNENFTGGIYFVTVENVFSKKIYTNKILVD